MTPADWIGGALIALTLSALLVVEIRHYRRNKRWCAEPYDRERP